MDSPSPSTSGSDPTDRGDARNGEGLAIDEIMRMKEKRLKLLDDYRNEQEESILPLMREADDANRKRKKKSRSQFNAENNIPLRRSERIMTQTLNENGTTESPMHQPELEPDPISEPQHEPEFEPEPAPREEFEPEPAPMVEPEPEPAPVVEMEVEPAPVVEMEVEPAPMVEPEPEPAPMVEPEPEPAPGDESEAGSESGDQSEAESESGDESEGEFESGDESEVRSGLSDESDGVSGLSDESEESEYTNDSDAESTPTDDSELEPAPADDAEQDLSLTDDSDQQAPPRRRRRTRRGRAPRHRFESVRPRRRSLDVQLAPRRVFAVHPSPLGDQMRLPGWRRSFGSDGNWYGPREGFDIGYHWNTRLECSHDRVHRPSIAGIHAGPYGAYSVALSGAYPEDIDRGNMVIFTGAGGRDLRGSRGRSRSVRSAPQVRDQELNKANLSLIKSVRTGNPVRLIRGHKLASSFAPAFGYRYDGLYRVVHFCYTRGVSGFRVFRFKMFRLQNQRPPPWELGRRIIIPRRMLPPAPRDLTPPPLPTRRRRPRNNPQNEPSNEPSNEDDPLVDDPEIAELDRRIEECIRSLAENSRIDYNNGRPYFPPFRGFNSR